MPIPSLTWYVADIVTGLILGELPISGPTEITSVVAREDTTTFQLPTADDRCPDDWAEIVVPGRCMIVLTIDDHPAQAWVIDDVLLGESVVSIPATTLEACLHRTNVPDLEDTLDTAAAAAVLCAALGPRFGITIEWTATGHEVDVTYSALEDRNLLDTVNDLRTGEHGAEWRIGVRWEDETIKQTFSKVLEFAPKIGATKPDVVFDLDTTGAGNIEKYTRSMSNFTQGRGATMLIGVTDGAGTTRTMTDPIYSDLVDGGWPVWEERVPFSGLATASVQDEDTYLLARTTAQLAQRERGARPCSVEGSPGAPMPGRDYDHGDTVTISIAPQGKRDPYGITGSWRVLGWKLNTSTGQPSPVFVEDQEVSS